LGKNHNLKKESIRVILYRVKTPFVMWEIATQVWGLKSIKISFCCLLDENKNNLHKFFYINIYKCIATPYPTCFKLNLLLPPSFFFPMWRHH
jgi:hypothetical protein